MSAPSSVSPRSNLLGPLLASAPRALSRLVPLLVFTCLVLALSVDHFAISSNGQQPTSSDPTQSNIAHPVSDQTVPINNSPPSVPNQAAMDERLHEILIKLYTQMQQMSPQQSNSAPTLMSQADNTGSTLSQGKAKKVTESGMNDTSNQRIRMTQCLPLSWRCSVADSAACIPSKIPNRASNNTSSD